MSIDHDPMSDERARGLTQAPPDLATLPPERGPVDYRSRFGVTQLDGPVGRVAGVGAEVQNPYNPDEMILPRKLSNGKKIMAGGLLVLIAAGAVFGIPIIAGDNNPDHDDNPFDGDGGVIGGPEYAGDDPTGVIGDFNDVLRDLDDHPDLSEAMSRALGEDVSGEDVVKIIFPEAGSGAFSAAETDDPRTLITAVVPIDSFQGKMFTDGYPNESGLEVLTFPNMPGIEVMYTGENPEDPTLSAGEFVMVVDKLGVVIVVDLYEGAKEVPRDTASAVPGGMGLAGAVADQIRQTLEEKA